MRILIARFAVLLMCLPALVAAPAQSVGGTNPDWSKVVDLPPASKLLVRMKDGARREGLLIQASGMELTLEDSASTVHINRQDIMQVYLIRGRRVSKATAIGAGAGAGAGAIAGAALGGSKGFISISAGEMVAILAATGAIAGAVTGLVVGLFRSNRTLIYSASYPAAIE